MRGEVLFEKMTGISDEFIAEAALVAPVGVAAPRKKPFASLSRALNSGWGVACICFIVAIAAVVGMVAWGRMGDDVPTIPPVYHPASRFSFSYEMTANDGSAWSGTAMPGDMVNVRTTIVNQGKPFKSYGFHAHAQFVLQEDDSIIIEGVYPLIDAPKETIETNRVGTCFFSFQIPENATPGVYDLVLSYKGTTQVYKGVLTVGDATGHTKFPEITTDHPFSFGYEPFLSGTITTGDELTLEAWVVNNGEHFKINGDFRPQATLCYKGETVSYTIQGELVKMGVSSTITYVESGATGRGSYAFNIPEDAPTGSYSLVLSYGGATQSFADVVTINDTPASSFSFGYEPFGGFAIPGDRVSISCWTINDGAAFSYTGYPDKYAPVAYLIHSETGDMIRGNPAPVDYAERENITVKAGEIAGKAAYLFSIPANATTGEYDLELSYGGASQKFEGVLTVAKPTVIDPAVLYNLTMPIGSDWLYEPINEAYADGEEVTVRIRFATDVGTLFFLNGEVIDAVTGDDQMGYWEYSFIMPQKDSQIIFHTYDGTAPYAEMLEACIRANPYLFDEEEFYYYGEFGDGVMVGLQLGRGEAIWSTAVGGYTFVTPNTHDMMAFHNGTLYELRTAYDMGLLTDEHLEAMMTTHKEWFPDD